MGNYVATIPSMTSVQTLVNQVVQVFISSTIKWSWDLQPDLIYKIDLGKPKCWDSWIGLETCKNFAMKIADNYVNLQGAQFNCT